MTDDRKLAAETIFHAVLAEPPESRSAVLAERCGGDPELRAFVERLLALNEDGMGTFLSPSRAPADGDGSPPISPDRIGRYLILEELGKGGFGEVFAAEQTEPVRRRVALKILKPGMDTREVLARFEAERQALAMMDHPNVCRVIDAGEAPNGRPYFVMELLQGEPITSYCDHNRVGLEDRLRLFLLVCQAIRHAHEKGVIHRDVKPSNVMVTVVDGQPVPKVIDFGIAKATAQPLTGRSLQTREGQVIGTPEYMSPEQAEPGLEVDARTDVYSLGVLLYELLTGQPPFETTALQRKDLEGMLRIIREEEPPRPSARVSTRAADAREVAATRRTDPAHLRQVLRHELDWIVMKAMEKDRDRRYGTVAALATDISRYLDNEPVRARPPSAIYRSRKFVRRHRIGVGFAATAFLAVAVGFVVGDRRPEDALPKARPIRVTNTEAWEGMPVLSPDGEKIAYVSDASGNLDVYVTDADGGEPLRVTDDPADDLHPFWFPDGSAVGFTSGRAGQWGIWKVGRDGGIAARVIADARDGAVSAGGDRMAAQIASAPGVSGIGVFDLDEPDDPRPVTRSEGGFWRHEAPAWSPDGRSLCYADFETLWIVPAGGGTPRGPIADPQFDSQPCWSPSGRHIYFTSLRGGTEAIWRLKVSSGELERVTLGTGPESGPSLSADGTKLAYGTGDVDRDVVLLDRAQGSTTRLVGVTRIMSLAPDGDRMLYVRRGRNDQADLWELPLEEGRPAPPARRLTDGPGIASHPELAPDGRWLAFYRAVGGRRTVRVMPAGGGEPHLVDEGEGNSILPVWAPDGSRLAYVCDRGGVQRVWVVSVADGRPAGTPQVLTPDDVPVFSVGWSPDGRRLAYVGLVGETTEAFVIPAEGGEPRQVTTGAQAQRVRWDPATGHVLVSGTWGEDRFRLRSVPPDGEEARPFEPEVDFGGPGALALFDTDTAGRYLAYARSDLEGDIWVLEAEDGEY